jgi:hypothetical protein
MTSASLVVTRAQILAFRRRVSALDERLPVGDDALRTAAWAGLQDSMPRAAVLSINARVEPTPATVWEHPALVQIWGPRFSVYVVAAQDLAVFTLGRFPDDAEAQHRATDLAARIATLLEGTAMPFGEAGRALGEPHNRLRYATTTGSVVLRWDGARQPTIRAVPPPEAEPAAARRELVRRYLHVFGPSNPESFGDWAGIRTRSAIAAFEQLHPSLMSVTTPLGARWMLSEDEQAIRDTTEPSGSVRLLPSGDTYFLLQGADRELLVPDADRRGLLWTSRVWPGAILADGEIVGTWRRAGHTVTVHAWGDLAPDVRDQIIAEAERLPIPENQGRMTVVWAG